MTPSGPTMTRVLTIAGSDSGGGAGIQADLKTITVLNAFGMSAITALTAQNTVGVTGVYPIPAGFVAQQMDAVLSDIGADAAKTGMLANEEIVRVVAEKLRLYRVPNVVVDPVMVAKSGDVLLSEGAREVLCGELLGLAEVVTPNLPEAAILAGTEVDGLEAMKEAARRICAYGPASVLIKGGHSEGPALDLLFDGERFTGYEARRIETQNTHGTGCTYSAAIAVYLGKGLGVREAVRRAKQYVTIGIENGLALGKGHGPTNPYAFLEGALAEVRVYPVA